MLLPPFIVVSGYLAARRAYALPHWSTLWRCAILVASYGLAAAIGQMAAVLPSFAVL